MKTSLFGGKAQHLLLATMKHQRSRQSPQLLQTRCAISTPAPLTTPLTPVPLAEDLLKRTLIAGQRMIHCGKQRKKLKYVKRPYK